MPKCTAGWDALWAFLSLNLQRPPFELSKIKGPDQTNTRLVFIRNARLPRSMEANSSAKRSSCFGDTTTVSCQATLRRGHTLRVYRLILVFYSGVSCSIHCSKASLQADTQTETKRDIWKRRSRRRDQKRETKIETKGDTKGDTRKRLKQYQRTVEFSKTKNKKLNAIREKNMQTLAWNLKLNLINLIVIVGLDFGLELVGFERQYDQLMARILADPDALRFRVRLQRISFCIFSSVCLLIRIVGCIF